MSYTKKHHKNKVVWIFLATLVVGIIIALLPILFPAQQCPSGYTPKTFDRCIIGADIGGGLEFFFGIFIALVAVAGLLAEAIALLTSRHTKETIYAIAIAVVAGLSLIVSGVIAAPLRNRTEVEKLYKCSSINYKTGETIYPAGYNYENFTENSHCQNLKGAPGAKINYVNPVVFSGIVLFLAGGISVATSIKPRKR